MDGMLGAKSLKVIARGPKMTDVRDEGSLRRYRTEIPNTVIKGERSEDLSYHARWLYVYLKSVAGDSGMCYQGTRTIVEGSGLSAGKITECKRQLEDAGLIRREAPREHDGVPGTADRITIVDIWPENMREFSHSPSEQTRSPDEHPRSPHEQSRSSHEHPRSRGETKKEPFKKEPKKKERREESAPARENPDKPSLDRVVTHATMNGIPEHEAKEFYYHYDAQDWEISKGKPIKRWKSKLKQWHLRQHKYASNGNSPAARGTMKQL